MDSKFDVGIVGAGPAGMMAAIYASHAGAKVALFDGNAITGKKLLLTGGGRCNLTNDKRVQEFVKKCGQCGQFISHSLYEYSPQQLRRFFAALGLVTKIENDDCVYPITDRASDVNRVLVDGLRRIGVQMYLNSKVELIEKHTSSFLLSGFGSTVEVKSLILATGGMSWPHTGSVGDGYVFASGFGHSIIRPRAALTGLITAGEWLGNLSGVSLKKVKIAALAGDEKFISQGPMAFTAEGIGGPCVYDISRNITSYLNEDADPVQIYIDLLPDIPVLNFEQTIRDYCQNNPRKEIASMFSGVLPRSLALAICLEVGDGETILSGHLTRMQRKSLVKSVKYLPLTVLGTRPLSEATITKGGVSTDEIDTQTMASKLCPGLFFAGEVMDIDGPSGGYNLQIAWSTGALAGRAAAMRASGQRPIEEVRQKQIHLQDKSETYDN
jgi:hypothetical protein